MFITNARFGGCRNPKHWGEGLGGPGATEPRIKRRLARVVPGVALILLRTNLCSAREFRG